MKFLIPSDVLASAVTWAARFLPQRPPLPVLAGMRLSASGGRVQVAASDLDVSGRASVPADVRQDGTVLVAGHMLAQIAARLPDGDVQVTADGATVELACRRARFTQLTMPADEYPDLPPMPAAAGEVSGRDFAAAAAQVLPAVSTDVTLPALTVVCIDFDGAALTLAATDRYRLAVREMPWQPALDPAAGRILVSPRVIADIARTMTGDAPLTLALASDTGGGPPSVLGVRAGDRELTARLHGGEYLSYLTAMPAAFTAHARMDTADLADAVKRVGVTAERNTPVRLDFTPGKDGELALTAGTGDKATGADTIPASFAGDGPVSLLLNPRFLADALGALHSATACLAITSPESPVLITAAPAAEPGGPGGYRHLLCTIRP